MSDLLHPFKERSNSQGGNCSGCMGSCRRNCPRLRWRCWEPALDRLRGINTRIGCVLPCQPMGRAWVRFRKVTFIGRLDLHFLMLLEESRNGWLKKVSVQGRSEVTIREMKDI